MSCRNCNSKNVSLSQKLNLHICNICGLIQANRIWENASTLYKPCKPSHFLELDLLCSEFNLTGEDYIKNYNTILRTGMFRGYNIDTRICAIVYYTLQDNNKPVHLMKYCKFLGCDSRMVLRLSKRISKHFGKVGVFIINDLEEYYKFIDEGSKELVKEELVSLDHMTLTRGIISAVFYEHSNLTQKQVCDLFGISLPRLKRNLTTVREND